MYKKILIGFSILGCFIFLVGGITYYNLTVVQIIFTNQSKFPIYNTEIWAAKELRRHGDLLPQKEISKWLFP
jgi:hypothetical protein